MLSVARYPLRNPICEGWRIFCVITHHSTLVVTHETNSFRRDCCREMPLRLEGIAVSLPAFGTATRIDRFQVVGMLRSLIMRLKRWVMLSGGMLRSSSCVIPSSPGALLAILFKAAEISSVVRLMSSSGEGLVIGGCWMVRRHCWRKWLANCESRGGTARERKCLSISLGFALILLLFLPVSFFSLAATKNLVTASCNVLAGALNPAVDA
jgi:hypothetical protein